MFRILLFIICFSMSCAVLEAQKLSDSIQKIYAQNEQEQKAGTGFFIHPNILATNYHVISGANNIYLLNKENPVLINTVLAFDKQVDLALVYSPIQGRALSFASKTLSIGEEVTTIGYPGEDSGQKKFPGIFYGWEKIQDIWHIQIHGYIIPGMSGGPVLNEQGEVVGVNRLGSQLPGSRLRGAILADYLKDMLKKSLDKPSFMTLDLFTDITRGGLELLIKPEQIFITED